MRGDVGDRDLLERALGEYEVEVVFHLAAQTIVGIANRNPVSTFSTNIERDLERSGSLPAFSQGRVDRSGLVRQSLWRSEALPYDETMPLQGRHPYEVSKSCADLIAQSYAMSYGLPVGDYAVRKFLWRR